MLADPNQQSMTSDTIVVDTYLQLKLEWPKRQLPRKRMKETLMSKRSLLDMINAWCRAVVAPMKQIHQP